MILDGADLSIKRRAVVAVLMVIYLISIIFVMAAVMIISQGDSRLMLMMGGFVAFLQTLAFLFFREYYRLVYDRVFLWRIRYQPTVLARQAKSKIISKD